MIFPGQGIIYNEPQKLCLRGVSDAMIIIANINVIIKISFSEF